MRALITGGAGFIGSHLTSRLLKEGYEVESIDDLSTGSFMNISDFSFDPKFRFIYSSVMNDQCLATAIDKADVIFHLAAAVGVKRIVESPVQTIETNVRATERVLEMAAKKGKRVLITSTSEVYGKSTKLPFNESDDLVIGPPTRGRWSYAASKLLDEFLALAYFNEKKLPVTVVRLFNTIGPRQTGQYGMVVPTFIEQAKSGQTITVYGEGDQSRCFGWVEDIVWALVRLAEDPLSAGQVFNIGGEEEISMLELAVLVREVIKSNSDIRLVSYSQAYAPGFEDMPRRIPDLRKIKTYGYRPTKSLKQMIETIAGVK